MTRVILETDVHCTDCGKKIRKAVQSIPRGQKVQASPETGLVVVTGTADAGALRRRIERKLDRPVDVVSDGAAPEPVDRAVPVGWGANRSATPSEFRQPYGGGGWAMPPRAPPRLYGAPQLAYPPYAGMNQWAMPPGRHVSHGVPARLDDEVGAESCCSIQ